MVINPEKLQVISQWGLDSDSKTVGQAMYELQTTDLRETISAIKVPTLVLGAWIAYKDQGLTKEMLQKTYDMQFEKLPNKSVVLSDQGKHFLMYDDLNWMLATMDSFLAKK
jgi:N-formylmaleamate deformylase